MLYFSFQLNGATYHSKLQASGGGVGRNMAEGICKLNGAVHLISMVGNDQHGDFLVNLLPETFQSTISRHSAHSTANCAIIFDKSGDSKVSLADMEIHREITPDLVSGTQIQVIALIGHFIGSNFNILQVIKHEGLISKAPIIVFDANITVDAMGTILDLCKKYNKPGKQKNLLIKFKIKMTTVF